MTVIDNDYFDVDLYLPDADVIARQVVSGKKKLGKYSPSMVDLATLIKDIKVSDSMKGSSTLVISVADPEWQLMDSGFFDANQDGKLDAIDVNYPEGSEYWWRLQNSDIEDSPSGHSMNFMERAACDMMSHKGPMKISRAKRTRAEFLKIAAGHVKRRPITFHCKELHKTQEIDAGDVSGTRLLYIGDSLGVGTVPELRKRVKYPVDARVQESQPSSWGESQLSSALTSNHFAVVFDMGTNDGDTPGPFTSRLDRVLAKVAPRTLIIATLNGPAEGMNSEIRAWASEHPQSVRLVDWAGQAGGGDGIHGNYSERSSAFSGKIPHPKGGKVKGINRDSEKKSDSEKKRSKDKGINKDSKVTFTNWDGNSYTLKPEELNNAETALDAAGTDDERALLVLLCAGIVEGPFFRNPDQAHSDGDSAGFLQLRAMHGSEADRRDIAWTTKKFMNEGFTGKGGAIKLAKAHRDWNVGRIAQAVQGSAFPDRYEKVKDGAKKILEAGGGAGTTGGGTYTKQYNFEIGSPENPNENFWDGSNRLAEEVKWAYFLDGQDLYFDSEKTLIKQKPIAVIDRDDPAVVSWGGTWDNRNIATEMQLVLFCDMFEYRAGQVFKLERFGPLSTGSTAELPGRWLISEIERGRYELSSTFTLKQPEDPAPEPAPETGQRSEDGGTSESGSADAFWEAAEHIDSQNRGYSQATTRTLADIGPNDPIDCSNSTALALSRAGLYDEKVGNVSGWFASSYGEPGRGKEITIWANGGHVFTQSETGKARRFDTGGGPPSGPHIRDGHRSTAGFTPRHPKGL